MFLFPASSTEVYFIAGVLISFKNTPSYQKKAFKLKRCDYEAFSIQTSCIWIFFLRGSFSLQNFNCKKGNAKKRNLRELLGPKNEAFFQLYAKSIQCNALNASSSSSNHVLMSLFKTLMLVCIF